MTESLQTSSVPTAIEPPTRPEIVRAVGSAMVGNWFELFDFVIYGYFSVQIGLAMFPSTDPLISVLAAFASYGVGFFMRPVGGLVLGSMGDRLGRKATLVLTMLLMAISTGCTGLIPSYDTIGIAAPILLVICRLTQGFAAGGEWGGATTFLVEYAPAHRRGLFGALQQMSGNAAVMSAVMTALVLNQSLGAEAMADWGWRLPFLFGFLVAPLGFYLRARVPETPSFRAEKGNLPTHPLREAFSQHRRAVFGIFGLAIIWTVAGNIFGPFLVSYGIQVIKVEPTWAYSATLVGSAVNIITCGFAGHFSDRFGRRPFLIASATGFLILAVPLFVMVATLRSGAALVIAAGCAGFCSGLFSGVAPTYMCELLPARVRYTALSVGYNGAVMIFGGFAPFIAVLLVQQTGLEYSPGFYVMVAAAISLSVILRMKPTLYR